MKVTNRREIKPTVNENIQKIDQNKGSSISKKILVVAFVILFAFVAWFSMLGSDKLSSLQVKPTFSARNLTGNHISSLSIHQYCILSTRIASKQEFDSVVKEKKYQTIVDRYKKGTKQLAKNLPMIKENCRKIIGGACPIKNGDLPQDPVPEPYEYTRMEKTLKWLDKTHTNPLDTYTSAEIKSLLCNINQKLNDSNAIDCNKDQIASSGLLNKELKLLQKSSMPVLTDSNAVKAYLRKEDPSSVGVYISIAQKINGHTLPEVKEIFENKLNSQEKQFIRNNGVRFVSGSETAMLILNRLSEKVEGWITTLKHDPYEMVSQSYMYCFMYSPFAKNNQKTAYVLMNFLLSRMGLKPVIFQGSDNPIIDGKDYQKDIKIFKEHLIKMRSINGTELIEKCRKKVQECSKNLLKKNVEKCDLTIEL